METDKLNYHLPRELIAQQPAAVRTEARLLVLDRAAGLTDSRFENLGRFLTPGDCLVLNDTKVVPARFFARRPGTGKVEALFLHQRPDGLWLVMLKPARRLKAGQTIYLKDTSGRDFCTAELAEKLHSGRCLLRVEAAAPAEQVLEKIGFAPLPPYVRRDHDPALDTMDRQRYQTVYARTAGAVAAPTAGLHFTRELIARLKTGGIRFAFVTLHVGAGTFKPVRAETLEQHKMEPEAFELDDHNARIINAARSSGGRIIAVGSTSVRVLEATAEGGKVRPCSGQTDLFIKPGYRFKMVDAMITNFHLPRSTLLALVAAFAGLETVLSAYRHAVQKRYRFYSYGDAMLIL